MSFWVPACIWCSIHNDILKPFVPFFTSPTPHRTVLFVLPLSIFSFLSLAQKQIKSLKRKKCVCTNEPVFSLLLLLFLSARIRHCMYFLYGLQHGMEWNGIILIFICSHKQPASLCWLDSLPAYVCSVWIGLNKTYMSLDVCACVCMTLRHIAFKFSNTIC